MASTTVGNIPAPAGSTSGSSRSRRSSWADSKVSNNPGCRCASEKGISLLQKIWQIGDEVVTYSDSHTLMLKKLDAYYRRVKRQILAFQSLTSGLFPNHLEKTGKVAHVLENVFCAIAVWSLRQCYIKIDNDQGRAHELGQSAIKCMRGILICWMKQAKKVRVDVMKRTQRVILPCSWRSSKENNRRKMLCTRSSMFSMEVKSKERMKSVNCKSVLFRSICWPWYRWSLRVFR